jgi:hypothetical protein
MRIVRKAVLAQRLSTARRNEAWGPADDHRRSKLDKVRSREPLLHRISQDY